MGDEETVTVETVEVPVTPAPVVEALTGAPSCDCGWCNRFGPTGR